MQTEILQVETRSKAVEECALSVAQLACMAFGVLSGCSLGFCGVCLHHLPCVPSCNMDRLTQPTLLNINGLFTQQLHGSFSLLCSTNDSAVEQQDDTITNLQRVVGMDVQ